MMRFGIIGAGIVGLTLARELLLRHPCEVLILEKEDLPGRHASGRNSCVIHSGINQKPDTLKSKLCLQGNQLMRDYCLANDIPLDQKGTLVVALKGEEEKVLEQLKSLGDACQVPGLALCDGNEIRKLEPKARGDRGLFSPTGAVVDATRLLSTLTTEVQKLGGTLLCKQEVQQLTPPLVITQDQEHQADFWINCAGLHADRIAHTAGCGKGYNIIPFRGEYYAIHDLPVNSMLYQVPDLRFPFLSVHLTRLTDGTIIAGPTAVLALGREAYEKEWVMRDTWDMIRIPSFYRMAFQKSFRQMAQQAIHMSLSKKAFQREIERLTGPLSNDPLVPFRAGIRAQIVDPQGQLVHDLLNIKQSGALHVLNAVSPGMTSSFAFATYLADLLPS